MIGNAHNAVERFMLKIAIKRIYDPPAPEDGFRVLVDRIWPRGVSKADAAIDYWAKDLAPSTGLRKWFNHEAEKWEGFQEKYRRELEERSALLHELMRNCGDRPMTLLFAAKDKKHNQAAVLKDVLEHIA